MRLSVSDLDSYHYYVNNEDASLDELLAKLRRQTLPTPPMLAGSALHKFLEEMPADQLVHNYGVTDTHAFLFDTEIEISLPKIRELKGETVFDTKVGPVTLAGVVDAMEGCDGWDHKFTRRFDAERYAESYQWRCYCAMFGLDRFIYNVFVGDETPERDLQSTSLRSIVGDRRCYTVYDFHEFRTMRYPGLIQDVKHAVGKFAEFVWDQLPEKR